MTKKIKICSLFSGVGGFEMGLIDALGKENTEFVFASEINPFASKAYEIIHKQQASGDITKVNEKDIPDHDLLVGGFPCQAFSIAGGRRGFDDARGTLFFEIARIALEKKPEMLLLENVKGLLNHDKGKTIQVIVETLSELGYAVDFKVLNSKFFNVGQSRDRIYIVGVRNGRIEKWKIDDNSNVSRRKQKIMINEKVNTFNFDFPKQETVNCRIRDILESDVEQKYFFDTSKTQTILNGINSANFNIEGEIGMKMVGLLDMKGNDTVRRVYHPEGLAPTLTTMAGGHREPKILAVASNGKPAVRKLTALECFRLQSFPDAYYNLLKENQFSNSQLYKLAGNAVTANVISAVAKKMYPQKNGDFL